jgi:hypothetical protein
MTGFLLADMELVGTDTFLIKKKGNLPPDPTIKKDTNHIYICTTEIID